MTAVLDLQISLFAGPHLTSYASEPVHLPVHRETPHNENRHKAVGGTTQIEKSKRGCAFLNHRLKMSLGKLLTDSSRQRGSPPGHFLRLDYSLVVVVKHALMIEDNLPESVVDSESALCYSALAGNHRKLVHEVQGENEVPFEASAELLGH